MVYSITKTKVLVISLLVHMIIYYIMYCLEVFLPNLFKKKDTNSQSAAGAGGAKFKDKAKAKSNDIKFDDINKPYDPKEKYEDKHQEPQEIQFNMAEPVPEKQVSKEFKKKDSASKAYEPTSSS